MKIVHILHELPYPPNSGIRCDMARRLEAFTALGHTVFAIAWTTSGDVPAHAFDAVASLERETAHVALLPIRLDLRTKARRVWNLLRYPSYVAARIPPAAERAALIARVRAFAPDVIWLEGIHPAWIALELKRQLAVPLLYRAHNIEHQYLSEQARLARTARLKLALTAGTWGLERMERAIHTAALRVFDISADDLQFWRHRGFRNNEWLPPQPDPAIVATSQLDSRSRDIDLLFVGSLSSPNNIVAVRWFLEAVHPLVKAAIADVRLVIAGRAPSRDLIAHAAAAGVEVIANPTDVVPVFARGRVMLNPILHGSGMNIKTVDMLATGQPVVTTTKGARGLPDEVKIELKIVDSAPDFAAATIAAVTRARVADVVSADRLAMIERVFGRSAVAAGLAPFTDMESGI